jgi:hypothetical protein
MHGHVCGVPLPAALLTLTRYGHREEGEGEMGQLGALSTSRLCAHLPWHWDGPQRGWYGGVDAGSTWGGRRS